MCVCAHPHMPMEMRTSGCEMWAFKLQAHNHLTLRSDLAMASAPSVLQSLPRLIQRAPEALLWNTIWPVLWFILPFSMHCSEHIIHLSEGRFLWNGTTGKVFSRIYQTHTKWMALNGLILQCLLHPSRRCCKTQIDFWILGIIVIRPWPQRLFNWGLRGVSV